MATDLPYRLGVGMMVLNKTGLVFVARRIDNRAEAWQMPQGGVDDGEDLPQAALRELEEEIGTRNVSILAESKDWHYYDLPETLLPGIWGGRYRGQQQKWYAMRYNGDDAEINIETTHPEFSEWKWEKPENLPEIIVPFKRNLYTALVKEFLPVINAAR